MDRDPYAAPDSGLVEPTVVVAPDFSSLLLRACLATIGGLITGGLLVALAATGYVALTSPRPPLPADTVLSVAVVAAVVGGLPALMFGAPGYALLVRWGWANATSTFVLGAAPGLVLLAFGSGEGLVLVVFGVVVALITHGLFGLGTRMTRGRTTT